MIVGTGANTGKFDIQLRVREMFLSGGYKVSQIGSKSYCELWGFHSFPDFMNKTLNAAEKIVRFNHYVNYIANSEDADIVIVGVLKHFLRIVLTKTDAASAPYAVCRCTVY